MMLLTDEQLNNLNREALVIIVASLQDQLSSMRVQLDHANSQLADTTRQIELLTEQIRIMNQRHFGRQSEWIFCFVRATIPVLGEPVFRLALIHFDFA